MTVTYRSSADDVTDDDLVRFFAGWGSPPDGRTRLAALRGSDVVVTAWDDEELVGFVTCITDGALFAFVPLLEVVPERQGVGIGSELMRRVLDAVGELYAVDLLCDEHLVPFYERLGMVPMRAMSIRRR